MTISSPTATTTVMLILQTIRDATLADSVARDGSWETGTRPPRTPDVRDITVGIIGLGTIGKVSLPGIYAVLFRSAYCAYQLVQKKVEALGMNVIYNNRHRLPPAGIC